MALRTEGLPRFPEDVSARRGELERAAVVLRAVAKRGAGDALDIFGEVAEAVMVEEGALGPDAALLVAGTDGDPPEELVAAIGLAALFADTGEAQLAG